jgi:hypothetical protein
MSREPAPVRGTPAGSRGAEPPARRRNLCGKKRGARTAGVPDGLPVLDDSLVDLRNVTWCTGFRPDFSWIHLPVSGDDGWPRQERCVAASAPGLHFAGLLFQ